ncbi:MAG: zinc ribbon domain-containing protein [Planctomycetota bacterium]|jgi:hypothetical protein|nr:zinc ribbon domain-containing protein [Planctomycetota bacterium]MDP6839690.1 zinc ribbon domain-containing protein [Planctomycetota bacterium]
MQRLIVIFLSCILTILFAWLLEFGTDDINKLDGPSLSDLRREMVPLELVEQSDSIAAELAAAEAEIASQREDQALIDESLSHSEDTMGQLMDLHRLSLEKGVDPTTKQRDALAESQALFLTNQARAQTANERVAELVKHKRELAQREDALEERLRQAREPADEEYKRLDNRHDFLLACLKLGLLIPLLAFVARRAHRSRGKRFLAVWMSALVATFLHVTLVMHEHFPSDLFKYIAITAGILIILAFLVSVLRRQVVRKPAEVSRKPLADAYSAGRCPCCSFPFQLKPRAAALPGKDGSIADREPYTCPSCGTGLFGACGNCGANRHLLLPYCGSCGDEKASDAKPLKQAQT